MLTWRCIERRLGHRLGCPIVDALTNCQYYCINIYLKTSIVKKKKACEYYYSVQIFKYIKVLVCVCLWL